MNGEMEVNAVAEKQLAQALCKQRSVKKEVLTGVLHRSFLEWSPFTIRKEAVNLTLLNQRWLGVVCREKPSPYRRR